MRIPKKPEREKKDEDLESALVAWRRTLAIEKGLQPSHGPLILGASHMARIMGIAKRQKELNLQEWQTEVPWYGWRDHGDSVLSHVRLH